MDRDVDTVMVLGQELADVLNKESGLIATTAAIDLMARILRQSWVQGHFLTAASMFLYRIEQLRLNFGISENALIEAFHHYEQIYGVLESRDQVKQ